MRAAYLRRLYRGEIIETVAARPEQFDMVLAMEVVEHVADVQAFVSACCAAVKPGGRVTVCGATSGPNPPAQLHRFWWKQLTVYGSTMGTREDFLGAYELVRSGRARAGRSRSARG